MSEEDIIKDLFSKTDLNYPIEGIEEAVLKKIELKLAYAKRKRAYDRIGKIGLAFFMILSVLFTLNIGEADALYIFIGSPFILLLLLFPLEILFTQKQANKLSYEKPAY